MVAGDAGGAMPEPSIVGARRGKDEAFAVCIPFPDEFARTVSVMSTLLESVQLQVVKPAAGAGAGAFEGIRVSMLDPTERASFRLKLHAQTDAPRGTCDAFVVNVKTLVQLLGSMRLTPESVLHLSRLSGDEASVALTKIENHDVHLFTLPTLEVDGGEAPELEDLTMPVSCLVLTDRLKAHMRMAVEMRAAEVRVAVQRERQSPTTDGGEGGEGGGGATAAAAAASVVGDCCFLVMSFGVGGVTRTDVLPSVMRQADDEGSLVVGEVTSEWRRLRDEGRLDTLCSGRYPVPFLASMVKGLDRASWVTLCLGQDADGQVMPLMLHLPIGTVNSEVRMLLAPCA